MTYNFKTQALSTIINDLPENEAWWVGTDSEKYIVPVQAVLEALERNALMVCPHTVEFNGVLVSEELAKIARVDADSVQGGNTYNSDDHMSHNLCYFAVSGADDSYYIAFAIHRAGDVRCNYTDFVIFQFESWEDCWETVEEVGNDFTVQLQDGSETYDITPNVIGEHYNVYCVDDSWQTELYPDDITDEAMIRAIREARA